MQTLSVTLLNLLPLSCAAFPPLDAVADEKRIPRAKFSIFITSHLSSNLAFRLAQVHAYSHVKQNHWTFLYSLNTTWLLCFRFVINQINWIKISTKPSDKNIPNIYQIFHMYQTKNLYTKHFENTYIYTSVGNTGTDWPNLSYSVGMRACKYCKRAFLFGHNVWPFCCVTTTQFCHNAWCCRNTPIS